LIINIGLKVFSDILAHSRHPVPKLRDQGLYSKKDAEINSA